jgi:hypothetical protein
MANHPLSVAVLVVRVALVGVFLPVDLHPGFANAHGVHRLLS